jgi:hypothetical protein
MTVMIAARRTLSLVPLPTQDERNMPTELRRRRKVNKQVFRFPFAEFQ